VGHLVKTENETPTLVGREMGSSGKHTQDGNRITLFLPSVNNIRFNNRDSSLRYMGEKKKDCVSDAERCGRNDQSTGERGSLWGKGGVRYRHAVSMLQVVRKLTRKLEGANFPAWRGKFNDRWRLKEKLRLNFLKDPVVRRYLGIGCTT